MYFESIMIIVLIFKNNISERLLNHEENKNINRRY